LWEAYSGDELKVIRAMGYSIPGEPKRRGIEGQCAGDCTIAPLARSAQVACWKSLIRCGLGLGKRDAISANNLLARQILPTLEKAGIEWHGWHGFRRALATNLHDLGIDDLTIQRILRHSNVSVTQRHYIKSLPAQSIAAMKRLEALIDGGVSENSSRIVQ
jgi:hypothetical protein